MDAKTYWRLSIMMFLQFFVWGSWGVTLGTHLNSIGFSGSDIGNAYLMNNIAAIVSPFFIGMIADRFFASQKIMGILHLLGGVILYLTADVTTVGMIILGFLLYNLTYMPTLALVNAVSFRQMKSPDAEFPKVRVWGTLGWIAAGLVITYVLSRFYPGVETTTVPIKMAAFSSILLGLYSFTLPNTPPQNVGKKVSAGEIMGVKAFRLLKERSFLIFVLCSLLISIPLAFYYTFTNLFLNEIGMEGAAGKQTYGQMSEVFFMILMPALLLRLGVKKMMLIGMLAWVVRYAFFANGNLGPMSWMLYSGILLHGICYDFFFVTGQIYVDKKAPKEIRASAQGFIALITYGVGIGLGTILAGKIVDAFTVSGVKDWKMIWWIPCIMAAAISLLFALTFKDKAVEKEVGLDAQAAVREA
ncbi:MAG: nucleoside permease [Blastocatellia bacterium]